MRYKFISIILLFNFFIAFGQNLDTKNISLDLHFDWNKKQVFGSATISASLLTDSKICFLDAGLIEISSIEMENENLIFTHEFGESDNNLKIELQRVFKPNEVFTFTIFYNSTHINHSDPFAIGGSFGKGLRFHQPTSTTPNKQKQIWSSGEPDGNKYWFPCNEDIFDLHTTELFATIENQLMVIGNGKLINVKNNLDGTSTFHYKSEIEFPNYLVSIIVGEFANVKLKSGKTTINNFGYPHEIDAVNSTTVLLPDMMQFLEDKTGFPYPFESYNQIMVQDYPFPGGIGQHTTSILSDNYIDDSTVHEDFKYLWDGVAMQAMANQWFGNVLMPKSWEDLWLNNAFAQYFAGMYTAKCYGQEEYLTYYLPFEHWNVSNDHESNNIHPIVPTNASEIATFMNDSYSKFKGALVLRMLQDELGDDKWWKAIRTFVNNYAYKQVRTIDFQKVIEEVSGTNYQWFFDQWIYQVGFPVFNVHQVYNAARSELTVDVYQIRNEALKTKYKKSTFFQGKISIAIDDDIRSVRLEPKKKNTFVFKLKKEPSVVNFNVGNVFYCQTNFEKTIDTYFSQLKCSHDVLAKKEAIDHLVMFALDSASTNDIKQKIITELKSEIMSKNHYWRFRWYVLGGLQKILSPPYSDEEIAFLRQLIETEKSWIKSTAIQMLGKTRDSKFAEIYKIALQDESDRVINAAAIALGKTKNSNYFKSLLELENQSSWKNQNRISALNGLQELGDSNAIPYILNCIEDNQSPRWYLATPIWDYPFAAVNALVVLGQAELGYPILFERFQKSLEENDLNDIFQNVQLINLLKLPQAKEMYELLEAKFAGDIDRLAAISFYKNQFLESL